MRPSIVLRATPTVRPIKPGSTTRAPPLDILPPLPLYRRLLRLHRRALNPEERLFGDTYLKAEFHRHKSIDNPLHIIGFLTQWQTYGQMVADRERNKLDVKEGRIANAGPGQANEVGSDGSLWKRGVGEWGMEGLVEKMSDQQLGQVWELYEGIRKRGREVVDEEDLVYKVEKERREKEEQDGAEVDAKDDGKKT